MVSALEERMERELIMARLDDVAADNGGFVTRAQLTNFDTGVGIRRLIDSSKGIWNPRDMLATLSIVSSPDGPYRDEDSAGGFLHYDYRAGSTEGDNSKLRRAGELGLPIILLRKIATSVYVPVFPVFVVFDDVDARQFVVAMDESLRFLPRPQDWSIDQRRYAQRTVKQRLHQPEFRGRVLRAYEQQCAICNLRHPRLLDAAHIIGDAESAGLPVVSNGLSLCKIHHGAYDSHLLGVTPDFMVRVKTSLLEEIDGPMLRHGIQEMDGRSLSLPKRRSDRPSSDGLAARYERFLNSA